MPNIGIQRGTRRNTSAAARPACWSYTRSAFLLLAAAIAVLIVLFSTVVLEAYDDEVYDNIIAKEQDQNFVQGQSNQNQLTDLNSMQKQKQLDVNVVKKQEQHGTIQTVSCPDILIRAKEDESFYDPNKKLEESPKRWTITQPPFWVSLHVMWFDKVRWNSIYKKGNYYEVGLTDVFHKILNVDEPGLVIDVGMNIGWFSLYARAHGHDVAAFEPNPVMHVRICESLQLNKWDEDDSVKIFPYGLGENHEFKNITMGNNPGASSFFEENLIKKFRRKLQVEVWTLDGIADEERWTSPTFEKVIYLLKVDVEGYEKFVFEGGKKLLQTRKIKNIIMEKSNEDLELTLHLFRLMYESGYRAVAIMDRYGLPYHSDPETITAVNEGMRKIPLNERDGLKNDEVITDFLRKVQCNIWFAPE